MAGSGTAPLRLEVREFTDLTRWRWTLTDVTSAFLADHDVELTEADALSERWVHQQSSNRRSLASY